MDLYGKALLDYFRGDHDATLIMVRDDGGRFELPASAFFRTPGAFSGIEWMALEHCLGRVLDIGAGTGGHALLLQEKGMDVTAIDIIPEAVEIMKARGVVKAECCDVYTYTAGPFDTLLMLGHGIGMTGTIGGLRSFLVKARYILRKDGILIFDSLDVRCTGDPANLAYQEQNRRKGKYIGEIGLRFEYRGKAGESWTWLQVDPDTLAVEAGAAGWSYEILHREPWGDYLAKLW